MYVSALEILLESIFNDYLVRNVSDDFEEVGRPSKVYAV